jgi:TPR repeat protein
MNSFLSTLLVFVVFPAVGFAQSAADFAEQKKKAEEGDAVAQFNIAVFYENGLGVPKNSAEAQKWFRKAEDQRMLGLSRTLPDFADTEKKAEAGDAFAQQNLGVMFQNGINVKQDTDEAVKWYRKAADQGNVNAQVIIANIYANGLGVPKNSAEALKWYRKAAEQGNEFGQNYIGYKYRNGEGVPKDSAEAVKWYRLSAEQGNRHAQNILAGMYYEGEGVPKDLVKAHVWWNIAGAAGLESAKKNLATVEKEMTYTQKEKAMDLARELFAKLPKAK